MSFAFDLEEIGRILYRYILCCSHGCTEVEGNKDVYGLHSTKIHLFNLALIRSAVQTWYKSAGNLEKKVCQIINYFDIMSSYMVIRV